MVVVIEFGYGEEKMKKDDDGGEVSIQEFRENLSVTERSENEK